MKARLLVALALAVVIAVPGASYAGVVASVHDLPDFYNYTGAAASMGTCSFCHVPHKADGGGEKLFPLPYAANLPAEWSSDSLSNFCWFCHGAASGYGSAVEVNPFQASSHLRDTSLLTAGIIATDPGDIAAVPTDMDLVVAELRCVSCHAIHDNTVKPFLRWGVSGNFSATATGTCGKCHPNRSNAGTYGTGSTNHPSAVPYADNTGGDSPVVGAALPTIMQNDMTSLAAPLAGAWNLGGHADWTTGAEVQNIFCGTCHAVHSNETTTWDGADGGTPVATAITPAGTPILVDAETATVVTELSAPICVDCHSVGMGIGGTGPGAAGTFSHPVGSQSTTGTAMFTNGAGYKWNNSGTESMIVCQSCHDIHWSGSNASGVLPTNDSLLAEQCTGCHGGAGTTVAGHHPSNIANADALLVGETAAETIAAGDTDYTALTQTSDGADYFAGSTTMTCETCHGLGIATAHNNATGFPGLTGRNLESDMCVDCHGFNPSTSTAATQGDGSHFVGNITTPGYAFAGAWTNTGGASKYSPDGGNGSIICESCHSLQIPGRNEGGLTSPDPGIITSLPTLSQNTGDNVADTRDAVSLLLQSSGNMHASAAVADYMCTQCHGGTPGGGGTHPVLPTYTAASTMAPTSPATSLAGAGAAGQINCESCHRPHDASTAGGAWILEASAAGTGYTDYSPTCALCHPTQY